MDRGTCPNTSYWMNWIRKRFPCATLCLYVEGGENRFDAERLQKDHFANYHEWLVQCLRGFMIQDETQMGRSIMPYSLIPSTNYSNFPPKPCQLRKSVNAKKPWCNDKFFRQKLARIIHKRTPYTSYDIAYIEDLTPYDIQSDLRSIAYENLSRRFVFQASVPPDVETKFFNLFSIVFPRPLPRKPTFIENDEDISNSLKDVEKKWHEWVKNYFEYWKDLSDGWETKTMVFPVPYWYERYQDATHSIPAPLQIPRTIRLLDAPKRLQILSQFEDGKFGLIWYGGEFHYHNENVSAILDELIACANRGGIGLLEPYALYEYMVSAGEYKVIETNVWGEKGPLRLNFPNSWPLDYLQYYQVDVTKIQGYVTEFPIPQIAATGIGLPTPAEMDSPPVQIFPFWVDLIKSVENPYAWGSFGPTIGWNAVVQKYNSFLSDFNDFLARNFPQYFHHFGLLVDHHFGNSFDDKIKDWKIAMMIALHYHLALKYIEQPWSLWKSIRDPSSQFPSIEAIRAKGFKPNWLVWIWDKKYLNENQKLAKGIPLQPPRVIAWKTLYDILLFCQSEMKQFSKIDLSKKPDLYNAFCFWLYHSTSSSVIDPISKQNDLMMSNLRTILWQDVLNTTLYSPPKQWVDAANFLVTDMYSYLVSNNQNVILERVNESPIDPHHLDIPPNDIPEPPNTNPVDWLNDNASEVDILLGVWDFWKKSWLLTEQLTHWPKFYYDGTSFQLLRESVEPVPGFWEKAWNTYKRFFYGRPSSDFVDSLNPGRDTITIDGKQYPVFEHLVLPYRPWYPDSVMDTWGFIQNSSSFLPILGSRPSSIAQSKWSEMVDTQWTFYQDWVTYNVKAKNRWQKYKNAIDKAEKEGKPDVEADLTPEEKLGKLYVLPGQIMLDQNGNRIIIPQNNTALAGQYLTNSFPSYGVFSKDDKSDYSWIFNLGDVLNTILDLLLRVARSLMDLVSEVFKMILSATGLDGLSGKALLIGGIFLAGLLGYEYIQKKLV